jgi:hypothetical protein
MGMFDTIRAILSCPVCGSAAEREIQTKQGPCVLLNLEVGDTIEPFFHGDYWMREQWYCKKCQRTTPEDKRWDNPNDVFIHCLNGLIVEIASSKPSDGFGPLSPARGAIHPIGWPAAVVSYRQDECTFVVSRINERIAKLSQCSLANTGSNFLGRFRKLGDHLFCPLNLG